MRFPVNNKTDFTHGRCYQCAKEFDDVPVSLNYHAIEWEAGRVNDSPNRPPEYFPTPARRRKTLTFAEININIQDVGKPSERNRFFRFIEDTRGSVEFCSTACLRDFFNSAVDEFENRPKT